ncbi:MAG: hypothetical protein MJ219_00510 [Mycoplasmoidaceae bacterium]|nr:hypothetical protein [Mycoplasmoidaceae bacterium]
MRKIHLLIPSILVASSMPMVSMVGCKKNDAVHVTGVNIEQPTIKSYLGETIHKKAKYAISPDNAADKAIT